MDFDVPAVMLAAASKSGPAETIDRMMRQNRWSFELKFDGIRAVVIRTRTGVSIHNRRRVDITYRYPDVVRFISGLSFTGMIDGEIIVNGPDGRPDFELAHRRDAQQKPQAATRLASVLPAVFMPFDVLFEGRRDVRGLDYLSRRERLVRLYQGEGASVPLAADDGQTMWAFVEAHALEGLIAKRHDSHYLAGRHDAWTKLKHTRRASVLLERLTRGEGGMGVLHMALLDEDGRRVSVGKVAGKATYEQLHSLLETYRRSGGANVVLEVGYLNVSSRGQLRQPVLLGMRRDVDPDTCTLAGILASPA